MKNTAQVLFIMFIIKMYRDQPIKKNLQRNQQSVKSMAITNIMTTYITYNYHTMDQCVYRAVKNKVVLNNGSGYKKACSRLRSRTYIKNNMPLSDS